MKASSATGTGISEQHRKKVVRRRAVGVSAVLGGTLLAAACGHLHAGHAPHAAGPGGSAAHAVDAAARSGASSARITITPKDASTDVGIDHGSQVTVTGGTLTKVTMVRTATAGGGTVSGHLSADRHAWRPDGPLARSTAYSITATAKDGQGRQAVSHAAFTTVSSAHTFVGYVTPHDGDTVGVGMPVSVTFDKTITRQAAVQSHISVTSSGGQRVVGHWFGGRRVDFRPQRYWKSGSEVTVKLSLRNVRGADGVRGAQNRTLRFQVGRSQVSTVDVATQTMTVVRDGAVLRDVPVSTGSPQHPTYDGTMVIAQKFLKTRMNGSTVGFGGEYDISDVPHAMRLTNSGTFIHGNYWSSGSVFGHAATSHGCIGIRDLRGASDPTTNAAWFYDNSLPGDLVVVRHSQGGTVAADNGLNGWNMPWSQWIAGSAVPVAPGA